MSSVGRGGAPFTLLSLFDIPMCDLGALDTRLMGIFCPEPEIGAEKIGITQQFLGDAEKYAERYSNSAHFESLFNMAFAETGVVPKSDLFLLDIGAGSGSNTVQPCLTLFRDCRIVATDLSPDLLRMLHRYLVQEGVEDRVICVCTDAMNNFFKPSTFDVVVGAAILHHLLDPIRALKSTFRALKPGGIAFFFEPFEGLAILRVAFDLILDRAAREALPLNPTTAKLLAAMSLDFATRSGNDKSAPHFKHMDDKWLFTRDWLADASKQAGFSTLTIVPHAYHSTLFRDYTVGLLRLGASLGCEALPDWAWDTLALFDRGFSSGMKRDLLLEGTIVLTKAKAP